MPNEITVTLKGEGSGPASEWLVIHAEDPNYLTSVLDAVSSGLGEKIADAGVVFRATTTAKAGTSQAAQAPAPEPAPVAPAQPDWTAPPAAQAPQANPWGQAAPVAQAPAQQYQQAPAQAPAYAPAPAQQPAQQWAAPGAQPAPPAFNPPAPGPPPAGTDGYPKIWKVGQPTVDKQGYGGWFSTAPRTHPNRDKPIFVVNTPKIGG